MLEIQGLDKLQDELVDLQKFMNEFDSELGTFKLNSKDSDSVENAIREMERMVDNKVLKYSSNATIMNMVSDIKNNLKQQIISKADDYNIEYSKE
ncbi:hypothetical protein HQR03_01285 [Psychrobacter okhotskensis]|uniref:hypothetical protein n=1 Tax=Psychrobacter okhotskensis TaxID=212403 RepID=UPI0015634568|nr:hypothetical protein [Psychrobacter okhotskensis]NRD69175.1 hypothetical protein [Psychrobacter okhotskensis]